MVKSVEMAYVRSMFNENKEKLQMLVSTIHDSASRSFYQIVSIPQLKDSMHTESTIPTFIDMGIKNGWVEVYNNRLVYTKKFIKDFGYFGRTVE